MKPTILVAPLHWGLGHATRCIPIIHALIADGYCPIIASDGAALELLQKEFPNQIFETLPSYSIRYASNRSAFKRVLIAQIPKLIKAVILEKKRTAHLVKKYDLTGIISDNRFGVRHASVPSVILSHQLQLLSGTTTPISSFLNRMQINAFDACWVPDTSGQYCSGALSDPSNIKVPVYYTGILSRFTYQKLEQKEQLLVLLSGPEPQRSILEEIVTAQLQNSSLRVVLVCGNVEENQNVAQIGSITKYNFMLQKELEEVIQTSALVISRSGYTTLLDMIRLQKRVLLIPTPGQSEQEYLADYFHSKEMAHCVSQEDFTYKDVQKALKYTPLRMSQEQCFDTNLLRCFQSKGEF